MLILLPPSEGKSAPEDGPTLDLAALSFPSLTKARRQVLDRLIALCRGDLDLAATTLGLGVTQRGEVGANALGGFLQNFVDFLIPPVRPVMRLKQHFGLAAEQRPGLRDRKRPCIAVTDLRAAQRI